MNLRALAVPALTGLVCGAVVAVALLALGTGQQGPRGATGDRGPAGASAYRGAYVLTDGSSCPVGTTLVNAEINVETNSKSGRSIFGLCYIK